MIWIKDLDQGSGSRIWIEDLDLVLHVHVHVWYSTCILLLYVHAVTEITNLT